MDYEQLTKDEQRKYRWHGFLGGYDEQQAYLQNTEKSKLQAGALQYIAQMRDAIARQQGGGITPQETQDVASAPAPGAGRTAAPSGQTVAEPAPEAAPSSGATAPSERPADGAAAGAAPSARPSLSSMGTMRPSQIARQGADYYRFAKVPEVEAFVGDLEAQEAERAAQEKRQAEEKTAQGKAESAERFQMNLTSAIETLAQDDRYRDSPTMTVLQALSSNPEANALLTDLLKEVARGEARDDEQAFTTSEREAEQGFSKSEREARQAFERQQAARQTERQAGAGSPQNFQQANTLRDEFNSQSKEYFGIESAYGRVMASAEDPSAAGDLALIFNYMKMLDPGSSVREGEFANAQNASGIPGRIAAQYNKVLSGKRLGNEQRADFVGRTRKLFTSAQAKQQANIDRYTHLSQQWQIDPQFVVTPMMSAGGDTQSPAQPAATGGGSSSFGDPSTWDADKRSRYEAWKRSRTGAQ